MTRQLRACTALTEGLKSGPSTSVGQLTTVSKSTPKDPRLSFGLRVHVHTCAYPDIDTQTHTNRSIPFKKG